MLESRLRVPFSDNNESMQGVISEVSCERFQIEYFKSGIPKTKCKKCQSAIKVASITIYDKHEKAWYDMDCFRDLKASLTSDFKIEE